MAANRDVPHQWDASGTFGPRRLGGVGEESRVVSEEYGHREGPGEVALEVLDDIEHGLAKVQRDEVVIERVGTLALMTAVIGLGAVAALAIALAVLRRWLPGLPGSGDGSGIGGLRVNLRP